MKHTRAKALALTAMLVAAAGMSSLGCKPKAIRGGEGTENPRLDDAAMSTGLDRKDLEDLMATNMQKLQSAPIWTQWKQAQKQPVIAIWPIKNDTTEHVDDQMLTLLSDMETELLNSGVVAVVTRERQAEMIDEVNLQNTGAFNPSMAAQIGQQIGADFFITGKLQSVDERINKERRVQYTLFLQVIEVQTSLLRYQTKSERSKAIVR